jgi:hypothetical protein
MSLRDGVSGKYESSGMNRCDSSEKQIPHPLARVRDDTRSFFANKDSRVSSTFGCGFSTLNRPFLTFSC